MIKNIQSLVRRLSKTSAPAPKKYTVVMTAQCCKDVAEGMLASTQRGHEGIVYFVGLTTGTTTLAVAPVFPDAATTPGSVDVAAVAMGKIVRKAAESGLQVVGQLHTHPGAAFHSAGDLAGMRIRYPGYISIVVPKYGALLPSLRKSHGLVWTGNAFQEIDGPIRIFGEEGCERARIR